MAGRRLGVRWSRAGLDAELGALAPATALGRQEAPPNLSVVVGERSGRSRSKHQLHVQGRLVCTTASDGSLVRAVVRSLVALAVGAPAGTLALGAVAVLGRDRVATAVDRRLAADLDRLAPRLRRSGHRIVDLPHIPVRPAAATAVLPDAAGALGLAVGALDRRWPRAGSDDDLTAGDVWLDRIVYAGNPQPESPAAAIADMVPMARDQTGRVRTHDIDDLAVLASATTTRGVYAGDRAALLGALEGG